MKVIYNMVDLSIITECYIDTNLIETIVPPTTKGYNHQKGAGTVTKLMQGRLTNKFAVGIVDKDKKQLKYAEEFNLKIDIGDLLLFQHKTKHHYLIFINPAIEKWIINNAKMVGISLSDYGLPTDLKELTKVTKKITSKNNSDFKKLFQELKKRSAQNIIILSKWLDYLKSNPYNRDLTEIKKIA
ncbi:MAG: hypothetical protein L3J41_11750 [Melioribacteraceae bacterium]|nr:hypothetical protein [Melioribacteraceae bacterium]